LPLPPLHVRPGAQVLPGQHGSFFFVPQAHSQPFALFLSQSSKPAMQVVKAQAPAVHDTPFACWTVSHVFEHEPQCAGSLRVFVSQPVLPLSQCVKPLAHVHAQAPAVQLGVPFLVLQATPHPPQLRRSALVSRHKPAQQSPLAHGVPVAQLSTHAPPGLHALPPVHSAPVMHSTHWCRVVWQWERAGVSWQSLSCLQPSVH